MKKLLWAVISLVFVLVSCSQDEGVGIDSPQESSSRTNHFYGVKNPESGLTTKGAAQKTKLWYPGSTIKVKFLGGTAALQEKVKLYAAVWEQHANIQFRFVTEGYADIRVGFNWNNDRYITWSCVGTDCKKILDQNEATMSFADLEFANEEEMRGDIRRAFGQALGMELEHRHLSFDAGWTDRIAEYWEGEIEDIPWESLKQYVFDPLLDDEVVQSSDYDPNSIMVWPFPRRYAQNTQRGWNNDLSAKDIAFIKTVYPRDEISDHAIVTMKTNKKDISLQVLTSADLVIDWGNGKFSTIIATNGFGHHTYSYPNANTRTIRFYGPANKLKVLRCTGNELVELDVSKNTHLEVLYCHTNWLVELDVSNNTSLGSLYCSNNLIRELNLSRNNSLAVMECYNNNIGKLDLSHTIMQSLKCYNNPIIQDRAAMITLAESLPQTDNTGKLYINDATAKSWILDICEAKQWEVE